MSLRSLFTQDSAAATPERSFSLISGHKWLNQDFGEKDHFTSASINQWAYNIYFNGSNKKEHESISAKDIPLEGDYSTHDVPKGSSCPSFCQDTKIQILTIRPHLPVAPSKGFLADVMAGATFKTKDGRLPGMQILGGSIQFDDDSSPIHILAIQPDEEFSQYPGSANVIVGLTELEAGRFWGSLASMRPEQRTMEPDRFPSVQRTCKAVSRAVGQWREKAQAAASGRAPKEDSECPIIVTGSKERTKVRSRRPYGRDADH